MTFRPGDPKPPGSGRKKGQKNKKQLPKVEEYLFDAGVHPVAELLLLMPDLQPSERAKVWLDLLRYFAPMVKPVEVAPEPTEDSASDDSETASLSDDKLVHLLKNNPAK